MSTLKTNIKPFPYVEVITPQETAPTDVELSHARTLIGMLDEWAHRHLKGESLEVRVMLDAIKDRIDKACTAYSRRVRSCKCPHAPMP